jgi:hypothetical protein
MPWCPNCALREKADAATWDTNGGDFWWCLGQPILPEFSGVTVRGGPASHYGPVNLRLFDEGTTYHAGLAARECPLFKPALLTARKTGEGK